MVADDSMTVCCIHVESDTEREWTEVHVAVVEPDGTLLNAGGDDCGWTAGDVSYWLPLSELLATLPGAPEARG